MADNRYQNLDSSFDWSQDAGWSLGHVPDATEDAFVDVVPLSGGINPKSLNAGTVTTIDATWGTLGVPVTATIGKLSGFTVSTPLQGGGATSLAITWASSAVNQVNSLVAAGSGSGTFMLTVEGMPTYIPIEFSTDITTQLANINATLNGLFGANAILASGSSLATIILTCSGYGFSGRPVAGITATILAGSTGYTLNGSGTIGAPSTCVVVTPGDGPNQFSGCTLTVDPAVTGTILGITGTTYSVDLSNPIIDTAGSFGAFTFSGNVWMGGGGTATIDASSVFTGTTTVPYAGIRAGTFTTLKSSSTFNANVTNYVMFGNGGLNIDGPTLATIHNFSVDASVEPYATTIYSLLGSVLFQNIFPDDDDVLSSAPAYGLNSSLQGTFAGSGGGSEPMIPIAPATVSVAAGVNPTIIQDVSTADSKVSTLSLQVTAAGTGAVSLSIGIRVAASGEIVIVIPTLVNYRRAGSYPIPAGSTTVFTEIPITAEAVDSVVVYATQSALTSQDVTSSGSLA